MSELTPKDVIKQESQTPEIVRFLRNALDPNTTEGQEVKAYINNYNQVCKKVEETLQKFLAKPMIRMVFSKLEDEKFRDGLFECVLLLGEEKTVQYIENYFKEQGIPLQIKKEN